MEGKTLFITRGFDSPSHAARQYCVKLLIRAKSNPQKRQMTKYRAKAIKLICYFACFADYVFL